MSSGWKKTAKQVAPPVLLYGYHAVKRRIRESRLTPQYRRTHASPPRDTYTEEFVEFVATIRGMDLPHTRVMIERAQNQFPGGWGGIEYRRFTELALETFRRLHDETPDAELLETYRFHGPIDFLRMLGYQIPTLNDLEPILSRLSDRKAVTIVDYGCGLAHRSIALSRTLMKRGIAVRLHLLDIRRDLHFSFLEFLCRKYGVDYSFIEVTAAHLYPELPPHDYCDIVSVLEHVREPLTVFNNIDRALRAQGLVLAFIGDAIQEMMHISPHLELLRRHIAERGYQQVGTVFTEPLLQKPLKQ